MDLTQKDFQVLDALGSQEIETQRQLAAYAGISLGQVNYIVKGLLDKGFIKIGKFRKSSKKIKYAYLLTPKGIEAKSKLAVRYVIRRLNKYHSLRQRMTNRLLRVKSRGIRKFIFVGPDVVCDFVTSIIQENDFGLEMVGWCNSCNGLANFEFIDVDACLIFDSEVDNLKEISQRSGIAKKKIIPLW